MKKSTRRARVEARRLFRACVVGGLLDEDRARIAVKRLAAARPRGALAILAELHRLTRLDRERHRAVVESAMALDPDLMRSVETRVVRSYGSATSTVFVHNPGLIGGMRVKIGSDVYDGSVRGALHALARRF